MAKINSSKIIEQQVKGLMLETAFDKVATETSDKVVVTYPIHRQKADIYASATKGTTGNTTVYTTPTDKDFYLTAAVLSGQANATADSTYFNMETTIGGATVAILSIPKLTTTATNQSISLPLPFPIKIDRGVSIRIVHSFTAGASIVFGAISGYIE